MSSQKRIFDIRQRWADDTPNLYHQTAEEKQDRKDVEDLLSIVDGLIALRNDTDVTRMNMCRTCRDPQGFGRTHSHDCGQTRKWFVEALDRVLTLDE